MTFPRRPDLSPPGTAATHELHQRELARDSSVPVVDLASRRDAAGDDERRDEQADRPQLEAVSHRLVDGASFILDAPREVPAVWGKGDEVLWAEGEPLMITGPTGVGKTTLGGQLIAARIGVLTEVLGYPVRPGRRVLYLAMDRPRQIGRALARQLGNVPRDQLAERLQVWTGPPAVDLARYPGALLTLAQRVDADTVVLDSLKDAAVKLSDDEVGQGMNRAIQHCIADGVEVLVYHHQRKAGGAGVGSKPNSIADVYGSMHLTAGMGSVVLLWGAAGDPVVELSHLKQPASPLGPFQIAHDHDTGRSDVLDARDPVDMLRLGPRTPTQLAAAINGTETPTRADIAKVRRRLDKAVVAGYVVRLDLSADRGGAKDGARGGSEGIRYALTERRLQAPSSMHDSTHATSSGVVDARPPDRRTDTPVSAGQTTHGSTHATHAPVDARSHHPLEGVGAAAGRAPTALCDRCEQPTDRPADDLGRRLCDRHAHQAGLVDDEDNPQEDP